jgi:hypothetical protein
MSKRRTRKQKIRSSIKQADSLAVKVDKKVDKKDRNEVEFPSVKYKVKETKERAVSKPVKPKYSHPEANLIKKDIFKSLFLAGFIFALQLVLYFIWSG